MKKAKLSENTIINKTARYFAFTITELMIVLTVVGVVSAILLPMAYHSLPDKNVMKFKKAHTTLYKVIKTLVSSNKYYCNGDLGLKAPNCDLITKEEEGNRTYFCETFADVISTISTKCTKSDTATTGSRLLTNQKPDDAYTGSDVKLTVTPATIQATKEFFDSNCKSNASLVGAEITATDNVVFYQSRVVTTFGVKRTNDSWRYMSPPNKFPANFGDQDGFDICYKIFCIDIDGFDKAAGSTNCDDIDDICPFGYGIRADGQILNGKRAQEWLEKSISNTNQD